VQNSKSMNSLFFVWWYRELAHQLLLFLKQFFIYLADLFSVKLCLKTLLSPWKRDQIDYEGLTLQDKFQVLILNMISRLVGAVIKFFTLISFCVVFVISFAISLVIFLGWFFYPLVLIGIIIWGLRLIII